jgi:hypothetical protein
MPNLDNSAGVVIQRVVPLSIRLFISAASAKYDSGTKTRTPPPRAPPMMFW